MYSSGPVLLIIYVMKNNTNIYTLSVAVQSATFKNKQIDQLPIDLNDHAAYFVTVIAPFYFIYYFLCLYFAHML